ncbi:MAG: cyclase [Oscillatoriales cyanobacterium C42_A2020_001]|nr:cyclase [Leptolyngbyaceae cyanobacterium C42_A2020_001]
MVAFTSSTANRDYSPASSLHVDQCVANLLNGDVIVDTKAHTAWGAAVTAQMYLPARRERVWQQLIDYPRWVQYFPDVTQSQVLSTGNITTQGTTCGKRLYQAASKSFLFITAQVEIYLHVVEMKGQQIQFDLESGSFTDFSANLKLKDYQDGTVLTYYVQATPGLPIPSVFIQQAIHLDLPSNMRKMRQVICDQV